MSTIDYIRKIITEKDPQELQNLNFEPGQNFDFLNYVIVNNAKFNFALNDAQWLEIMRQNNSSALMEYLDNKQKNNYQVPRHIVTHMIKNSDLSYVDEKGWDITITLLRHNKEKKYNLKPEEIEHLITHSNLKQQNKDGWNTLMISIRYNANQNLNIRELQIDKLIDGSNLWQQNENGWNVLMDVLRYNTELNFNISRQQIDKLIDGSNLWQQNQDGWNALMLSIRNNAEQNLNISEPQLGKIIDSSNLGQQNKEGWDALMLAMRNFKKQNIPTSILQKLIQNSDLYTKNNEGLTALHYATQYLKAGDLDNDTWDYLIANSPKITKKEFKSVEPSLRDYLTEKLFPKKSFFSFLKLDKFKRTLSAPISLNSLEGELSYNDELVKIYTMIAACIDLNLKDVAHIKVFNELMVECKEDFKISKAIGKSNTHIKEALDELHRKVEQVLLAKSDSSTKNVKSVVKYLKA